MTACMKTDLQDDADHFIVSDRISSLDSGLLTLEVCQTMRGDVPYVIMALMRVDGTSSGSDHIIT